MSKFERVASCLVVACAVGAYGYFAWTGRNAVGAVAVGLVFGVVFWFGILRRFDGADARRKQAAPSGRAAFAAKNWYALTLCISALVLAALAVAGQTWGLLIPAAVLGALGSGLIVLRHLASQKRQG